MQSHKLKQRNCIRDPTTVFEVFFFLPIHYLYSYRSSTFTEEKVALKLKLNSKEVKKSILYSSFYPLSERRQLVTFVTHPRFFFTFM